MDSNKRLIVTHAADAARYVDCGWEISSSRVSAPKGLNKKYMEVTVIWPQKCVPVFPEGDAPAIVFSDSPDLMFIRRS